MSIVISLDDIKENIAQWANFEPWLRPLIGDKEQLFPITIFHQGVLLVEHYMFSDVKNLFTQEGFKDSNDKDSYRDYDYDDLYGEDYGSGGGKPDLSSRNDTLNLMIDHLYH